MLALLLRHQVLQLVLQVLPAWQRVALQPQQMLHMLLQICRLLRLLRM
jgi:hypothetical protein